MLVVFGHYQKTTRKAGPLHRSDREFRSSPWSTDLTFKGNIQFFFFFFWVVPLSPYGENIPRMTNSQTKRIY